MLKLQYRVEAEDFVAFNVDFAKWQSANRKWRSITTVAVYAGIGFCGVVGYRYVADPANTFANYLQHWTLFLGVFAAMVALLIPAGLLIPAINSHCARLTARKVLRENPSQIFLGDHIAEFSDNGIRVKNDKVEAVYAWAAVERFSETKEHLFIYLGSLAALIIPTECLKDRNDGVAIKAYVEQHALRLSSVATSPG